MTPQSAPDILPLGVLADTGDRLPGIDPDALAFLADHPNETAVADDAIAAKKKLVENPPHLGVDDDVRDPNSLKQCGWAVIWGRSVTPNIKTNLGKLLQLRRQQVNNDKLFVEFEGTLEDRAREGNPRLAGHEGETATDWLLKGGKNIPNQDVDPKAGVPYYVLIVASPSDIPFEFQFGLDLNWAVGRLWFHTYNEKTGEEIIDEDAFLRYAESVVAYEKPENKPETSKQMVIFSPRNGQDGAMDLVCRHLAGPMLVPTDTKPRFGADQDFRLDQVFIGETATRQTLDNIWRGTVKGGPPALLFTGSHGMCFFSADLRQSKGQGAIVCEDWSGVGSPKPTMYYDGAAIPPEARIHGMIHVMFDCYGAGWPKNDTFTRTVTKHPLVAPRPQVAYLPQCLLAHENKGALAVIAHVDRAWSCSYFSKKTGPQVEGFRTVMNRIMDGTRVGHATDRWNQRWAMLSSDLLERVQNTLEEGGDLHDLKNPWIARDDARNYIVLGDPAVQLRVDDLK